MPVVSNTIQNSINSNYYDIECMPNRNWRMLFAALGIALFGATVYMWVANANGSFTFAATDTSNINCVISEILSNVVS